MKRPLFGTSEYRPVLLVLLFVALLSQALVFAVYYDIRERTLNRSRTELKIQAQNMSRTLEEISSSAVQLIQSTNAVAQQQTTVAEIEKTLHQLLSSAPSDTVYGIGIWARPSSFVKNRKLFGPYVHRKSTGVDGEVGIVLTYEWETTEYNYPQQNWYKSGEKALARPVFTEPYVDAGMTWVSLTRSWIGKDGKARGVLTVDLVLPQLQAMIESFNQGSPFHIYLTTQDDKLLAHPLLPEFLKQGTISQAADLIKISPAEYLDQENRIWKLDQMETVSEPIKNLNWKLVIKADQSRLLSSAGRMTWLLLVSGGIMILLVSMAWIVLMRISRQLDMARATSATSAKMASLGEMAGGIAHEINTPLAIIGLLSAQIQDSAEKSKLDPQAVLLKTRKIESAVEKAAAIIRSLRLFSKDATQDPFGETSLKAVFENTFAICQQRISDRGIELKVDLVPGPLVFQGREVQISQVILNLINNSVDALQNAPTKWIQISTSLVENRIEMRFQDSGILSADAKTKLFQPFFTTKEPGKGTGLGLSISKQIIEMHGGRLYLDEFQPHTCFVITLPLAVQPGITGLSA